MLLVQFENPDVVEAIQQRFDGMTEDVARLHQDVPEQLVEWQTEDMNRRYPNIEEAGQEWIRTWTTRIWPRSRLSYRRRTSDQKQRARTARPPGKRRTVFGTRVKGSHRPILRDTLYEMLLARMRALLDAISWKKK